MLTENNNHNLQRFLDAQASHYHNALTEIKNGKKQSHWMWYIFPQIAGLGFSETSKYYAIKDIEEAKQYLQHPTLGTRLIAICNALLHQPTADAHRIFGSPDDMKLRSSMTLFSSISGADMVFRSVLARFFNGEADQRTIDIITG